MSDVIASIELRLGVVGLAKVSARYIPGFDQAIRAVVAPTLGRAVEFGSLRVLTPLIKKLGKRIKNKLIEKLTKKVLEKLALA